MHTLDQYWYTNRYCGIILAVCINTTFSKLADFWLSVDTANVPKQLYADFLYCQCET